MEFKNAKVFYTLVKQYVFYFVTRCALFPKIDFVSDMYMRVCVAINILWWLIWTHTIG